MTLKATYEFLFVGKDDGSFLENYTYDLFHDHGEKSGQIFINLEIQNNPVDAEEIATAVFQTMQNEFFDYFDSDPYDRFENAVKAVNQMLSKFKAEKSSGYIGNLNVVISAIVGENLYLTSCGEAEAYLVRKRYVTGIADSLDEESEDDVFVNIANGKLESGDFVIFATSRLLRYISKTDLAQSFNNRDVVATLEDIKSIISSEILGKIGVTGMIFSHPSDEEVAEVLDEDGDVVNKGVLESRGSHVSAEKETLTGKFLTAISDYRDRKARQKGVSKSGRFSGSGSSGSSRFEGFSLGSLTKEKILLVLLFLIVILFVGIFIVNGKNNEEEDLQKYDQVLTNVQNLIAEAETKGLYDPQAGMDLLDEAYEDAKTVFDSGNLKAKSLEYLNQISDLRDQFEGVNRITDLTVYADLSEKRDNVNALGFALTGDFESEVYVYEYNALYPLVLDQVEDPLTIDDDEEVLTAVGFEDRGSVVFLTESGQLVEYLDGAISFMDTDDGKFRNGVALEDWSNNIYILDSVAGQIWKYAYRNNFDSFTAAEAYLNEETNIVGALDLAIDSYVYVLKGDGSVLKFLSGSQVDFELVDAPESLNDSADRIYTNENIDQIYLLDRDGARVFVFDKDLETGDAVFRSQYVFEDLEGLRDMYVTDDGENIVLYLLDETQIYQFELGSLVVEE